MSFKLYICVVAAFQAVVFFSLGSTTTSWNIFLLCCNLILVRLVQHLYEKFAQGMLAAATFVQAMELADELTKQSKQELVTLADETRQLREAILADAVQVEADMRAERLLVEKSVEQARSILQKLKEEPKGNDQ